MTKVKLPKAEIPDNLRWEGSILTKLKDGQKDKLKIVYLTDIHAPYHCVTSLILLLQQLVDYKPDIVVIGGDLVDWVQISKHAKKGPVDSKQVIHECKTAGQIVAAIRQAVGKKCRIIFFPGNHDIRLDVWSKDSDALSERGDRTLANVLYLDKSNVEIYNLAGVMIRNHIFTHGTRLGTVSDNAAKNEALDAFASNSMQLCGDYQQVYGHSGHIHRPGSASVNMLNHHQQNVTVNWFINGCLCQLNPEYMPTKPGGTKWSNSYRVIESYRDGRATVEQITIVDGKASFRGKEYVA